MSFREGFRRAFSKDTIAFNYTCSIFYRSAKGFGAEWESNGADAEVKWTAAEINGTDADINAADAKINTGVEAREQKSY